MEIDPGLIDEAMKSVEKNQVPAKKEDLEPSEARTEQDNPPPPSDEMYDRLLRVTADFDNFRKRTQKEKSELVRYGNEQLLRDVIPILDNFERAVEHSRKATDAESIRTGVELILNQLKSTLERFGVKSRSAAGEKFDPLIHEAVNHVPSAEHPPHTVIEEHQKAYFLHDRLIRPALVTVSKGPDESGPEEPASEGEGRADRDTNE